MTALFIATAALALLVTAMPARAQVRGVFPSPDGRASVILSPDGEATLSAGGALHDLGPMPEGPAVPLNPDIHIGGRYERAVWSPDSRRVALAGRCNGYSGVTSPPTPKCSRDFVRIVDVAHPETAFSLSVRWTLTADEIRVESLAFDDTGDRLAIITVEEWSDCSYEGYGI